MPTLEEVVFQAPVPEEVSLWTNHLRTTRGHKCGQHITQKLLLVPLYARFEGAWSVPARGRNLCAAPGHSHVFTGQAADPSASYVVTRNLHSRTPCLV
jgi:hypothetical protein